MTIETNQVRGKVIVITGVTSGFGRGSAKRLARMGAHVVGAARRSEVLEELRTEITERGGDIHTLTCDVSRAEDNEMLAKSAIDNFGRIDVWINNVGVGALGYFWDIPMKDHARVVDVNLKGLIFGAHVALKEFIKQNQGILINVGSVDSEVPLALQNTYAATKAGVLSLSHSLKEELKLSGHDNIKVATIMPWAVDTPWWNHAANYTGHKPRMAAMDGPEIVIDKIVEACSNPKLEMPVGPKATASDWFHKVFPGLTEKLSGKVSKAEAEMADPMPHTTGSIYEPMEAGTTVEGNIRERMEREDERR